MNNIKWIFFDVGCTLVDEEKCWRDRCHRQANTEDCKSRDLNEEKIYDEIIEASINYLPQYREVERKLNFKDHIEYNADLEELYPETIDVLNKLYGKYKLGIIANQIEGLKDRLIRFGINKYFDVVISSFDVKLHKPDERIFLLGLNEANAKANECVYVGDRIDNDIIPAKKLGFKTIWILQGFGQYQKPRGNESTADYIVKDLNQLLDIL